jgi:hypothetical protein
MTMRDAKGRLQIDDPRASFAKRNNAITQGSP